MKKLKPINIASLMMLTWLAFYILAAFFATGWADFLAIIGCTVPMLVFGGSVRGETFGTRDFNTVIYKKSEYVLFFIFTISGCALISALTYFITSFGYIEAEPATRGDFPYLLVFGCFLPAFFEEWLVRGGVLGALAPCGKGSVLVCAIFFMLMHADPKKYLYALFAGLLISALVYLTECIYFGMLLHFLNNFTSLLLSFLPRGAGEYIALAVIAAAFVISLALLIRGRLFSDTRELLIAAKNEDSKEYVTPLFNVFVVLSICVMAFRFI